MARCTSGEVYYDCVNSRNEDAKHSEDALPVRLGITAAQLKRGETDKF
jgi:hypothetical protein